jgi:thymidylate kinase
MDKKILITGIDLTGKTTLIENFADELKKRGIDYRLNKSDLVKTTVYSLAKKLMDEKEDPLVINSLLFSTFFIDAEDYSPSDDILIQDSYFCRTIAYCDAFNVPYISEILRNHRFEFVGFDKVILLQSSFESKINRNSRELDDMDKLLLTNPEITKIMETSLEQEIRKTYEDYITIDTSKNSINQVRDIAIKYCESIL